MNQVVTGFLDDLLYNHTMNCKINSSDDFNKLMNELYKIVEDKYKSQLHALMPTKEVKVVIDRTFNSWDLFVSRLEKHDYRWAHLVKKHSYKSLFFADEQLKKIYDKL